MSPTRMQIPRLEPQTAARWLGLAVVVGAFVCTAASFLPRQCLWVDETTQMTGVGLGPAGAVCWLTGGPPYDTDQVRDRTPPLSFWLQWGWSRVFGFNEASLRWFGLTCVAAAVALVYEAARRALGTAPAWLAGLTFALSPQMILEAVEIRAYPVFIFWSALAFYLLVRLHGTPPDRRWTTYSALALVLAAAIATHFYGALLAGSIVAALVILASRGAGRFRSLIAITGATILSLALVSPFVIASLDVAKNGVPHAVGSLARLDGLKKLVVRLVTDPEFLVSRSLCTSAVVAAAVLSVLAIGVVPRSRRCVFAIALSLGIGLAVVTAAQLVVTHFPAANYNYNIWMRPAVCILLSAGLAAHSLSPRRIAVLASALVVAVEACGTYQLAAHGDSFAHGPHRAIVELIRAKNQREVAVVHDDALYRIMLVYHSLRYELGPDLAQYQLVDAVDGTPLVRDQPSGRELHPVTALPYRYLVVVRLRMGKSMQPAAQTSGGGRALEDGRLARALCASADWQHLSGRLVPAHFNAQIDLFESRRLLRQDVAGSPARQAKVSNTAVK